MNGILIETDLIVEFLTAGEEDISLLRRLLETVPCYTTFLQAAEIYSTAHDDEERRRVEKALFGLKILGASSRYAKTIAQVLSSAGRMGGHRTAIVAAMAMESRLPVVTDEYLQDLSNIPGLHIVPASSLRQTIDHMSLGQALAAIEQ